METRATMNPADLSDLFDSSLKLEQIHLDEGFDEGYKDGLASGFEEGRQVGLKHGFIAGEELGFYRGCVSIWESTVRIDPDAFSERVRKGIVQMGELIDKYPMTEPEDESLQDVMGALRSKFRVVTAGMGIRLSYDGYLQEDKGIEF